MFDYSSRLLFPWPCFMEPHWAILWDRLIQSIISLNNIYASCPKFWPIPQWCWRFFSAAAVLLGTTWAVFKTCWLMDVVGCTTPIAGWFIREHPIKMDDLWWFGGTPISGKPPIYWRWSKFMRESLWINQYFMDMMNWRRNRWLSLTPRHFWKFTKFTSWPRQWHSFRVVFPFPARPHLHGVVCFYGPRNPWWFLMVYHYHTIWQCVKTLYPWWTSK